MPRPWVAVAVNALLLAGCGGAQQHTARSVTLGADEPLRVAAHEYYFDPSRAVVARSGELTIVLRNRGSLAHDLRVMRGGRDLGGTPVFEGGRRTASIGLARGRYRFLCTVGDHARLGMVGTLLVR